MSDIVERLRRNKSELQEGSSLHDTGECRQVMSEAADEIERLRKQLVSDIKAETEIDRLEGEVERLRRIEASYNNILQAERDLRRLKLHPGTKDIA